MMSKIFSRFFSFLKYLLLLVAFALTLLGIMATYKRLEKSLVEAIPTFLPFLLLLLTYIVNLFIKSKVIKNNLLYNLTSVLVLGVVIIIGVRAKFDTGMLLYYKYKINYNPLYFSDNLAAVRLMLYCLTGANVLYMVSSIFERKKVVKKPVLQENTVSVNPSLTNNNVQELR